MWVFTHYGFHSIACASKSNGSLDNQSVMVRARCIAHLRSLQKRFPALAVGKILGIKAKLNQRCCLGGTCELGFDYLVGPRSEGAGLVDPNKEVRPPAPLSIQKCRLIEGIDAIAQRPNGLRDGVIPMTVDVDLSNRETVPLSKPAQVSLLVNSTPELGMIHHPDLGNDFANQLSVTEKAYHRTLGDHNTHRLCDGTHVGGGNGTAR